MSAPLEAPLLDSAVWRLAARRAVPRGRFQLRVALYRHRDQPAAGLLVVEARERQERAGGEIEFAFLRGTFDVLIDVPPAAQRRLFTQLCRALEAHDPTSAIRGGR